ncbi:MvdC/MvdD family ATP grasp protein [Paenibacillus sp. NPDC058071]|uniref:MvdC/MvdD family ATP grasp protein n=1 Tax=Paenibacillus sp. NPDC058071 TaxID=3346326 RepID=UPI0036DC6A1B
MQRILTITYSKDATVDYMIKKYSSECMWYRLDVDRIQDYRINISSTGVRIANNEFDIHGNDINAVYYRKVAYPDLSLYEPALHSLMQREIMAVVEGLAESLGSIALTRPSILRRSENKLVQLNLAHRIGFRIPESLITNDNKSALHFIKQDPAIVKPLATGRVKRGDTEWILQTNQVDQTIPIEGLEISPSYFQKYIPKVNGEYRVTFVGDDVYTVRINSNNPVDWRKKGSLNVYSVTDIPKQLLFQCQALMKELSLEFAAFDFIHNGEEFVFLEANPNGQWLWLEQILKIPISQSILKVLQKGTTAHV